MAEGLYRLVISGSGKLLHLARHEAHTMSLCGRDGMCTAAGWGTVDEPRGRVCARCEEARADHAFNEAML